jgi:cell division protein FtsN
MAQNKTSSSRWGMLFVGIFIGIIAGLALALTTAWKLGGNAVLEVFTTKDKPASTQRVPDNASTVKNGGEKMNLEFYKVLPEGGDATTKTDRAMTPPTSPTKPAEQHATAVVSTPEAPSAQSTSSTTPAATPTTTAFAKPKEIYWLQVGSFSRPEEAENRKVELALHGWEATIQKAESPGRGVFYRVRIGPYDNAEQTGRMKAELTQRKFDVAVVRQ